MRNLITCILLLISCVAYSQVNVAGYIQTNGVATYPTHIDSMGRGGLMVVADATARTAIPLLRKKIGMLVSMVSDGKVYRLTGLPNTWTELSRGIYSGSDSLSQAETYVKMNSTGTQTFGIGYWPDFPDRTYNYDEYGLLLSRNIAGEVTLSNKKDYISLYDNSIYLGANQDSAAIQVKGTNAGSFIFYMAANRKNVTWDTSGLSWGYKVLPRYGTKPSTTASTVNILKWTGDGTNAVPSFGTVPNWYNTNGTLTTERVTTLAGSNGDYWTVNGTSNNKLIDIYFSSDGQYDTDSYFRFRSSKTNQTNNYGNFNWSHYVYGASDKTYSVSMNAAAQRSNLSGTGSFYDMDVRRASGGFKTKHLMQVDSVGRIYNYLVFKADSVGGTISGRQHISGFAYKTLASGNNNIIAPTKSWLLQTNFFNSSTKFDWLRVDNLDTDTTSNRISLYNGKIVLPNAAPGSGNKVLQWVNGVPGFISTPSGSGSTPERVFLENSTATSVDLDAGTTVKDRDGSNTTFTFPTSLSGLRVYKNGMLLAETGSLTTRDYACNTGTNTITFTVALISTDRVIIEK